MLLFVDEQNHQWEFAPGIDQGAGLHAAPADESSNGVHHNGIGDVLLPEIVENLEVRGASLMLVGFVEVDGYLNGHGRNCK